MDQRTFNTRLASRTGMASKQAAALSDTLVTVIRGALAELDAVAIPGFGTFTSTKKDEHVVTDEASGRTMLMPPSITADFTAGSQLKKQTISKIK